MAQPEVRIAAGDRGFEERVQQLVDQFHSRSRCHSIELPDGSVLPGLQSVEYLRWRLDRFGLPEDLRGKRVLDVGAWDGWFSFECERRGAQVVAVDCVVFDTFLEAKERIGSSVEYLILDVDELSARRLGRFDIVLFFGVLYHLRHPLLGLEKTVELSTDLVLIESFVIQPESRQIPAIMEFYERSELGGQIDNWWGPSPECLVSMCRSAGLAQVEIKDISNQRASLVCRRRWPEPDTVSLTAAPQLVAVTNNRTHISSFHPLKDEYLCCYFKSAERGLIAESVVVEVDGYGTHTLVLAENGAGEDGTMGYQANCLRPPGLDSGRHEVRVRTRHSGRSNPAAFTMLDEFGRDSLAVNARSPKEPPDLPAEAPELFRAEFHPAGDLRLAVNQGGSLACYFRSRAQSVFPGDVTIEVEGEMAQADTIGWHGDGVWQASVLLGRPLTQAATVRVRLGEGEWSALSAVSGHS